jgi:ribonuclease P protein component
LTHRREYQKVFSENKAFPNTAYTILTRPNELGHARLGMAVSKKACKKAIGRNRIKRQFRESFRLHQQRLPAVDIVVLARPEAAIMSARQLRQNLEKSWDKIVAHFSRPVNHE